MRAWLQGGRPRVQRASVPTPTCAPALSTLSTMAGTTVKLSAPDTMDSRLDTYSSARAHRRTAQKNSRAARLAGE